MTEVAVQFVVLNGRPDPSMKDGIYVRAVDHNRIVAALAAVPTGKGCTCVIGGEVPTGPAIDCPIHSAEASGLREVAERLFAAIDRAVAEDDDLPDGIDGTLIDDLRYVLATRPSPDAGLLSETLALLREFRFINWGHSHIAAGSKGSDDWNLMERTDALISALSTPAVPASQGVREKLRSSLTAEVVKIIEDEADRRLTTGLSGGRALRRLLECAWIAAGAPFQSPTPPQSPESERADAIRLEP
jgi:hypothetical protein